MPRVVYLWQGGYPWEVRVEKICRALVRQGWEVTILARARRGERPTEILDGMRLIRVGGGMPRVLSAPVSYNPIWHRAIHDVVHDWKPDLVIAREILLSETASLVSHRRRVPVIIDMAEHYPASMRSWKKYQQNPLLRFLVFRAGVPDRVEKRAVQRADGVITVCHEQIERLHASFGYPRKRMAVVENTPDLEIFAAAKKGPDRPARVFAYHGTMTAQRGLDNLVKGFALAAREDPEIRLVLAGGGESYEDLVALARSLNLGDRVHFTGRYKYDDLVRLYGETDVGVIPQPADESCDHTIPNKLYDYLACGKPVIVSNARPLKRVVEETQTGLALADVRPETIARGLLDIRRLDLERMSHNALRVAGEKYHWGHDVDVMMAFLKGYLK